MSKLIEDLDVYFGADAEFSETVQIDGNAVDGVFRDASAAADGFDGSSPSFETATSSLPALNRSTSRLVRTKTAKTYSLRTIDPDGTGATVLSLHEV